MNDDLCLVFLLSEDTEHDLEHAPEQLLRFGMPPPHNQRQQRERDRPEPGSYRRSEG